MRQMEIAAIAVTVFCLTSAGQWFELTTLDPLLSWNTFLGLFTFGLVSYLIHDLYWIHRSVSYMIERRAQNIAELQIEEAEQLMDVNRP